MREVISLGVTLDERVGVDVTFGPSAEGGDGGATDVFIRLSHDGVYERAAAI